MFIYIPQAHLNLVSGSHVASRKLEIVLTSEPVSLVQLSPYEVTIKLTEVVF